MPLEPGQHHGDGTVFATDELIELVAEMLGKCWKKGAIKRAIVEINGGVSPCRQTMEKILSLGRALLRQQLELSPGDAKGESVEFYRMVIADEKASWSDRLKAREALDALLGLDPKFKNDQSVEERARKLKEALAAMDASVKSAE